MKWKLLINHFNDMWSGATKYPKASEERYSIVSRRNKISIQMEVGNNTPKRYNEKQQKSKLV